MVPVTGGDGVKGYMRNKYAGVFLKVMWTPK